MNLADGVSSVFKIPSPFSRLQLNNLNSSAFCKAAMLRQGSGITRAMQYTNDHKLVFIVLVVDSVIAGETNAQAWREIVARGPGQRKIPQRLAILFDPVDEARCSGIEGFDGDVEPDFSKVGFCRFGQTEGERSANSFLPRAMMFSVSKSFTRPSATSARPASISALSAASSSI